MNKLFKLGLSGCQIIFIPKIMAIWSFFVHFDYLRQPFEFKLVHDKRNGTVVGGLLSLFFGSILMFYFFVSYISVQDHQQSYSQDQYRVQAGDKTLVTNEQLSQADVEFVLAFQSYDNNSNTIFYAEADLLPYFSIRAFAVSAAGNDTTLNPLIVESCTTPKVRSHFAIELSNLGNVSSFEQLVCFRGRFNISGNEAGNTFEQVRIIFVQCSGLNCSKQPGKFLRRVQTNLYIKSQILSIDITNGQLKKQDYIQVATQSGININQPQSISVAIQQVQVQFRERTIATMVQQKNDLESLIGTGVQIDTTSRNDLYFDRYLHKYDSQIDCLLEMKMIMSPEIYLLTANLNDTFLQVFDGLSRFGGLFTTFFTFISIFYKFYQRHNVYLHLMNKNLIFDLGKLESSSQYVKKIKTDNFLLDNFTYEINFSFISYLMIIIKQFFIQAFHMQSKLGKDELIFQYTKEHLMEQLDLTHLLEKIYEIDKIKLMLMDLDQLTIFNSLAKPVIQIQRSESKTKLKDRQNSITVDAEFDKLSQQHVTQNLVSFKTGIFQAKRIERNGYNLLNTFQRIFFNENLHNQFNNRLMKLLRMNRKLFNVLTVQQRLQTQASQARYTSPTKKHFRRAVQTIISMKKKNSLENFITQMDKDSTLQKMSEESSIQRCKTFVQRQQSLLLHNYTNQVNYVNPKMIQDSDVEFD